MTHEPIIVDNDRLNQKQSHFRDADADLASSV
jgi:hypothetical protein